MTTVVRFVGRPSKIGKTIEKYLVAVSDNVQDQQISQRMVATGSSLDSHKVTIFKKPDAGQYEAADYYTFLVKGQGRAAGTYPPTNVISKWIRDRGISIPQGMTLRQLTFLIQRKIKEVGTEITEGRKGIDLDRAMEEPNQEFAEAMGDEVAKQVSASVLAAFERFPDIKVTTNAKR